MAPLCGTCRSGPCSAVAMPVSACKYTRLRLPTLSSCASPHPQEQRAACNEEAGRYYTRLLRRSLGRLGRVRIGVQASDRVGCRQSTRVSEWDSHKQPFPHIGSFKSFGKKAIAAQHTAMVTTFRGRFGNEGTHESKKNADRRTNSIQNCKKVVKTYHECWPNPGKFGVYSRHFRPRSTRWRWYVTTKSRRQESRLHLSP